MPSDINLYQLGFFPVTMCLQVWLHFSAPSHQGVVAAVRSLSKHLLQLHKPCFLNLSRLWLPTHCGRPLLATFQYVSVCHGLENPTSGLVLPLTSW